MNLTDDEILKCQRGSPILLDDICAIYPATLGEIVDLGYTKFQQYLGILTSEKPASIGGDDAEAQQILDQLTDYQYILMMTTLDKQMEELLKLAFQFFTHESIKISLEPPQIIVGDEDDPHILDEEKFYEMQRILRRMYFLEQEGEEIIIEKDDDPVVKRMKQQMKANREKVRLAKAKQARQSKSELNLSDLIGSITINNCGLNMDNIWNITYYALQDQLKRMGWRDQFLINNQAALAGAKLKKNQLKHWIRSIADNDKS